MRILAPFGFYGWGNIGDEATLNGFARLLSLSDFDAGMWIGSRNPAHTARTEPAFRYFNASSRDPRRWWAKLFASAHAVVGGTPIMDVLGDWPLCDLTPLVRASDRSQVPMVFIGVGIESLRRDESRRLVAEEIAPRVRHWTVRSDRDRKRLEEYGVAPNAITVAADMAWLIEGESTEFGQAHLKRCGVDPAQPLIGVNLVNENSILDREPGMVDAMAAALDELIVDMGARVIFLANEVREDLHFDKAAALQVMRRMKRADRAVLTPNEYFSPRQMMSIIGCCDLTMSMRYHFCLFSALQGVPFIAIERSDKVSDLCWDLDWQARVVPPRFEAGEIVAHAKKSKESPSAVEAHLKHCIQRMRERAMLNAAALHVLKSGESVAGDPRIHAIKMKNHDARA